MMSPQAEDAMMAPDDESFLLPLEECRRAIADLFYDDGRRLDVRRLWTRGDVSTFRVNWWSTDLASGDARIRRSVFVAVRRTPGGLEAYDCTRPHAA